MVHKRADEQLFQKKLHCCTTFEDTSYLLIRYLLESTQTAITHLAMVIDFQTSDYVVAVQKVAEQCISTKFSICNSFQVISDFTHYGRY